MWKTKKSSILIALVVLMGVFVYFGYAKEVFRSAKTDEAVVPVPMMREVSAEVTYDTPGDYPERLRFVVTVDRQGVIQSVKAVDAETNAVPEKKKDFNGQISVILQGKKLAELSAIDKVGKASLTTAAFNSALPQLQAAL